MVLPSQYNEKMLEMNDRTVYVIDDDSSARTGISRLLDAAGYKTFSFSSAKDFLSLAEYERPSCIVLDVRMPHMTGPELQEVLNRLDYAMPIIFLSGHGDVPMAIKAMKKGALDFLTKPVDGDVLLEAVGIAISEDALLKKENKERKSVLASIKSLTTREYDIMTYVISGILNKQIAAELGISIETVKIHRGRVMHKLDIVSVAELVRICEKVNIPPAITPPLY